MTGAFRHEADGLLINRNQPLSFRFNGKTYHGYRGDTLASALLANGVHLVGRSFKLHRPRGIFSAGVEEPNALVALQVDGVCEPNVRATEILLTEGLEARSQNCWPSVGFDIRAVTQAAAPLLGAGFYYKTFMGPGRAWMRYEPVIRRAAGLGEAPERETTSNYDKYHEFCDVLVIGAGPAGLAAALSAARTGARVWIADERPVPGGDLLGHAARIDGDAADEWITQSLDELSRRENVQVLLRASVFGCYRHRHHAIAQKTDSGHVLHLLHARQTVMATGAIERPLVFAGNDRPGIMLAGAARRYVQLYGVCPGRRVVIITNNDSAYDAARALVAANAEAVTIVDTRETAPACNGADVIHAATIIRSRGRRHVRGVDVQTGSRRKRIRCDLLCVSGGWTPTLHVHAYGGHALAFDEHLGAFVADSTVPGLHRAGLCNGTQSLAAIVAEGWQTGADAVRAAGFTADAQAGPPSVEHSACDASLAVPLSAETGRRKGKRFVDLHNDVTVDDLELALREGYRAIEHVKRYTTLGMGTDQGRTSNINGMRIVAERLGKPLADVGTTTFRPPYAPVTLSVLAGRESGSGLDPVRRSPMHACHERMNAVFVPSALWVRPQYYRDHGDTLEQAAFAEAVNVRRNVGMADVSTLGKIEIQGADAAEFLDRIYVNRCKKLAVGKARYGLMLREDGCAFDDGTSSRLAENRYLMTTTTANAGAVLTHLEFYRQMVWPQLDVNMTSVTDQWAVVALAGPNSRQVLEKLFAPVDVGNAALPHMGVLETRLHGVAARISRLSFSGERAYEIAVPADYGEALWTSLLEVGEPFNITPYGLEAMEYLRLEKGHVIVGAEIDGRVTPHDLGMARMLGTGKHFVGARSLRLPAFRESGRQLLAGFMPCDRQTPIAVGAQLVARPYEGKPARSLGRITSVGHGPAVSSPIGLGLIAGGADAHDTAYAVSPLTGEQTQVQVTAPIFYDPNGERLRD